MQRCILVTCFLSQDPSICAFGNRSFSHVSVCIYVCIYQMQISSRWRESRKSVVFQKEVARLSFYYIILVLISFDTQQDFPQDESESKNRYCWPIGLFIIINIYNSKLGQLRAFKHVTSFPPNDIIENQNNYYKFCLRTKYNFFLVFIFFISFCFLLFFSA